VLRRALSHPKAAIVVGAALGIATTAAYLIGSGRSFGYDAAATFGNFVATPNLIDAFAVHSAMPSMPLKSIASNDHVFLSLISHVIYSLTGSRSEVVYRLVPALAGGGTVAVSATVLARRFGLLAGACAGLFIATNPLFVENSRDLRGYSLAAFLALLATLILATGTWNRRRVVCYALLLGLAPRDLHLGGVDHDHVIAGVHVRREDRLVLAAGDAGHLRGEASEDESLGVHQEPGGIDIGRRG